MVSLPPGFLMWFVVHPFAPFWRRLGTKWTYAILVSGMLAIMFGTYVVRDVLLATDLGTNFVTIVLAIPCIAMAVTRSTPSVVNGSMWQQINGTPDAANYRL